ncbi:MAG: translation elongation factor Ts [bacterium]
MVDVALVQKLREMTAASILDCKKALEEHKGDMEKAVEFLRKKGVADAVKKQNRQVKDGLIASYIHQGGRLGVLVELNCETDFVAKTKEFGELAHDLAMQVAAANPLYVKRDEISGELIAKEKEIYRAQVTDKPPQVVEKIVEGKLEKYFAQVCLMEQPFIRDPKINITEVIKQCIAKVGENISVKRFIRFELGAKDQC